MKQATKRLISFALGVVLIFGALLIFFNLVRPAFSEAQAIKSEKLSRENFYKNQQSTQKQVDEVLAAYRGSTNPQALADQALPPVKGEADLLNQISFLASRSQMAIQNITASTPGARVGNGKRPTTASTTLVKPVGMLNIQLRIAGSYANFKSFLSGLESNIRIMDIGGLSIAPVGKSNQDYYTYEMAITAYYQNP